MGDNPIWSELEPEGIDATDRSQSDADELPAHEQDELRRRADEQPAEADPAAEGGLPEHEQDARRGYDTSDQPYNP